LAYLLLCWFLVREKYYSFAEKYCWRSRCASCYHLALHEFKALYTFFSQALYTFKTEEVLDVVDFFSFVFQIQFRLHFSIKVQFHLINIEQFTKQTTQRHPIKLNILCPQTKYLFYVPKLNVFKSIGAKVLAEFWLNCQVFMTAGSPHNF
jgi:hypothetical protein